MQGADSKTKVQPISYELWQPTLVEMGFSETDNVVRGTDFDEFRMTHQHRMYTANADPTIGKISFYERNFSTALKPQGALQFDVTLFRDGEMYGKQARVDLFDTAGLHVDRSGVMYAAAIEICRRLGLDFVSNWAHTEWDSANADLDNIVDTLERLKVFHGRMHSLYQSEGIRLANLAESLEKNS
jgi:hypothetical protein